MKKVQKVLAALLAVVLVVSMASCGNVSLTKQWSYKYGDKQYDIGVYIYSLYSAYLSAQSYAEKAKGYDENESFLDLKIKDDDGEKAIARDWIKEKAEESARQLVVLDKLIKSQGVKIKKSELTEAEESAKNAWEMGPYAMYGANYYNPLSKQLEPYGISYDSFKQIYASGMSNTPFTVKTAKLFDSYYDEGGTQAVSDEDLGAYFTANYVDYSYIPVKLYTSETDSDGASKNTAFDKEKIEEVKKVLEGYAEEINSGSADFDAVAKKCEKKYSVEENDVTKNKVEDLESTKSSNEDIYNSVSKLETGKAAVVTKDTDGDTPSAYIVVKNDINADTENYVSGDQRKGVLQNMKSEDFKDFLKKEGKALDKDGKFSRNDGAIDGYDPNMFFTKPEETTAASEDSDDSSDSE